MRIEKKFKGFILKIQSQTRQNRSEKFFQGRSQAPGRSASLWTCGAQGRCSGGKFEQAKISIKIIRRLEKWELIKMSKFRR